MKKVHAYPAPKPRSWNFVRLAWLYGFILVVMACVQLVSFEKFIPLINSYELPGGYGTANLVAGLIVVSEVFALPYLLRMRLSYYFRWFSLGCSVLAPLLWLKISVYSMVVGPVKNGGLMGVYITLDLLLQLVVTLALLGLSCVVAYGLWPRK